MSRWLGVILVLLSAASFGFMPLFASWSGTVSVPVMLMLRFGIAAAVLFALCLVRKQRLPKGRLLLVVLAMGAVGYFGESFMYFAALSYAPSGIVSLLLYTYPAIVAVLSVTLLKETMSADRLLALALAVVGSILTAAPALMAGGPRINPLGIIFGLVCACSYATYVLVSARLPKSLGALPASTLVCTGASLAFAVVVLIRSLHQPEPFPATPRAWAGILCLALVCTVFGVTTFLAGLPRVGPVRASTLSTFEPIMTVAVGVAALGEHLTPIQVAGGVLIIIGAVLMARARDAAPAGPTRADAASSTS
jgi:drug/metabolite transporter (DMT)-like permease